MFGGGEARKEWGGGRRKAKEVLGEGWDEVERLRAVATTEPEGSVLTRVPGENSGRSSGWVAQRPGGGTRAGEALGSQDKAERFLNSSSDEKDGDSAQCVILGRALEGVF